AQGKAVKPATAGDKIKFPNVDTCMAIVYFLDDGNAVGGHVPMMWGSSDDMAPAKNFKKIVGMMNKLVGRAKIEKIVTAGDRGDLKAYKAKAALPSSKSYSHVHLSKQKDVIANVTKKTVS
ncbi:MAG: hypothetical protein GY731_11180, partial [Gammaproteobacteria bacterium]|nr:hypothetical protein [Gammaproteobacteria bacterium]